MNTTANMKLGSGQTDRALDAEAVALFCSLPNDKKRSIVLSSFISTSINTPISPLLVGLQQDFLAGKFDGSP